MEVEMDIVNELAKKASISPDGLLREGLKLFLMRRKKELILEKLEILSRYGLKGIDQLEEKIRKGEVPEHPAWEDLIEVENIEDELREIQSYLDRLSRVNLHS